MVEDLHADAGRSIAQSSRRHKASVLLLSAETSVPSGQSLPAAGVTPWERVRGSAWFPTLASAAQQEVLDRMHTQRLAPGEALSRQGELQTHWCGVLNGLLKWSSASRQGRSLTLGGLSVGSWFGEGSLLRQAPREAEIVALRPSLVALLPRDVFEELVRTQPGFALFLLRHINERLQWFMGDIRAHRLLDVDSQVARALVGLFHPVLHPGASTHLAITQEEVAQLIGISRQRCNSALRSLQTAGLLRLDRGSITVLELDTLRGRVEGGSAT